MSAITVLTADYELLFGVKSAIFYLGPVFWEYCPVLTTMSWAYDKAVRCGPAELTGEAHGTTLVLHKSSWLHDAIL